MLRFVFFVLFWVTSGESVKLKIKYHVSNWFSGNDVTFFGFIYQMFLFFFIISPSKFKILAVYETLLCSATEIEANLAQVETKKATTERDSKTHL